MQAEQVDLRSVSWEYLAALRPVRVAKTIAWLLVWVALAIQMVCFVLVRFTDILEISPAAPTAAAPSTRPRATTQPEAARAVPARSAAAEATATGNDVYAVQLRRQTLGWLLAGTKFIGPVAALALMAFLLGAAQVSLAGRLGGAGGFTSAFVWSVFLLLLLVPWQQYLGGWLSGALCGFDELQLGIWHVQKEWSAGQYTSFAVIAHLASFLLYPFIALLVWILVGLRFAQGMRKVHEATSVVAPSIQ